jgi:chromosome segregation ATPase
MVEILKSNVKIEGIEDAMDQDRNKIKELTAAINALALDLEPREQQLEEIRRTNEPLEAKVCIQGPLEE